MTHPSPGFQPGQRPYAYPPQPVAPPVPRQPAGSRWPAGLVAAFSFAVATAATVWGTFEEIQTFRHDFVRDTGRSVGSSATWWVFEQLGSTADDSSYPPYGVLPSIAAGLLLVATVLALSAFGNRGPGLVTAVRVSSALGAGLLAGVIALRLMDVLQSLSEFKDQEIGPGQRSSFDIGLGIWLPAGAVVVALFGLMLTLTRPGTARARIEPDTPRMGVPMPYGYGTAPIQPIQQPAQQATQRPSQPHQQPPASQPVQPAQPAQHPTPQAPQAPPAPPAAQPPAAQPEQPPRQSPEAPGERPPAQPDTEPKSPGPLGDQPEN